MCSWINFDRHKWKIQFQNKLNKEFLLVAETSHAANMAHFCVLFIFDT